MAFVDAWNAERWRAVLDLWYTPARDWPASRRKSGAGGLVAAGATLEECESPSEGEGEWE